MLRITMNYVHDKEEALDVMQDSFHKALNYFEKEKEIEHFSAWFYRILIRTALDSWRRKKGRLWTYLKFKISPNSYL